MGSAGATDSADQDKAARPVEVIVYSTSPEASGSASTSPSSTRRATSSWSNSGGLAQDSKAKRFRKSRSVAVRSIRTTSFRCRRKPSRLQWGRGRRKPKRRVRWRSESELPLTMSIIVLRAGYGKFAQSAQRNANGAVLIRTIGLED